MPIKGKGPLRVASEDFWQTFIYEQIILAAKRKVMAIARTIINRFLNSPIGSLMDENTKRYIHSITDDLTVNESFLLIILLIPMLLSSIAWVMLGNLWSVPALLFTYKQNRIFETYRADISSYVQMMFRNPAKEGTVRDEALDLGINSSLFNDFINIYRPQMTPTELTMALNRLKINEGTFKLRLKQQGWTDEAIEAFYEFRQVIPPITDQIRFMVREAYSEDIVAKFGYDSNFPSAILSVTRKLGLADEDVKRYWRAHWNLPSDTQGFEMLHRLRPGKSNNPFTETDLAQLMRANDVPEFYIKRLMEISYNPLTRVDIRRMRQTGKLDKQGVYDAYRDGGYNHERATQLAEFVEDEFGEARKELSRSLIESGYDEGILYRGEAISRLKEIGYGDFEADYILDLVDFRQEKEDIKDETSLATEKYLRGIADINQTRNKLSDIGLTQTKVDSIVNKLERIRENDERFPTITDLKKFYVNEIISETELREEMRRMNISDINISRYIRLFNAVGD